jgi:O-antigen ligase
VRRIAFWSSLVLIFIIPWEDSVNIAAVGSVARLMGFVVAAFWLLTILTEGRLRRPHPFHLAVILFFLWNILSVFWTLDIDRTVLRMKTYGQLFLLILIFWEFYKEPTDLIAGLQAYVLGGFVAIASAVINYASGRNISIYELRYSASGVNANDLTVILILGIPIAWHLFVGAKDVPKKSILRWVNLAYIPLAVFAAILTGSRTGLFALVPVTVYILWSSRARLTRLVAVSIFLSVSMLVLYSYIPQSVIARLGTTAASLRAADLGGRVYLWRNSMNVFLEHPLLGSGSGTLTPIIGGAAHNTFLSVAAETGIIGLALFLAVLATVLWQAIKLPKGYSGFWITVLMTWAIGVSTLSWEFRKPTWFLLSFVVIEGYMLRQGLSDQKAKSEILTGSTRRSFSDVNEPQVSGVADRLSLPSH